MAKLYRKVIDSTTLRCYSERGLMSYFMFHVLPQRMREFLQGIEFAANSPNRVREIRQFDGLTLFSELGFGNEGFGNPDGAIWFRNGERPVLIMVEVKLNQTWKQSCRATATYNSTIRGQLELKWRLMNLYKSGNFTEILGVRYVVENDTLIRSYKALDGKYSGVSDLSRLGLEGRRRLRLVGGVGEFFEEYVRPCPFENIFYLSLTKDKENPLNTVSMQPTCVDVHGENVGTAIHQFCWLNTKQLEI
jgi:hypothetical protein